MKRTLKRLVFGKNPPPEYPVIGTPHPQQAVRAYLDVDGTRTDVTADHAVAALRPLLVATGSGGLGLTFDGRRRLRLEFESSLEGTNLGSVELAANQTITLDDEAFHLFDVVGRRNPCISPIRERAIEAARAWMARRKGAVFNHQMSDQALRAFYVLYSAPRPVALISFDLEGRGNMYPMDLIGRIGPRLFTLALHHPSPILDALYAAGRLAVSIMPMSLKDVVFELGKNHRRTYTPWEEIPLRLSPSPSLGIQTPAEAVEVIEASIERVVELTSHNLLVTRIVATHRPSPADVVHHTQGFCFRRLEPTLRSRASLSAEPGS